jgi:hypothetical protein
MLSSDLALLQHMPGHHLTQEKDRLRVHADAAIKTVARNLQEIATLSNTDPGIVNDTIDSSPGRRRCFNKLCMLGADFGKHIAQLRDSQKEQGKEPSPPDPQTDTGMLGLTAPPMGAWMIGWSIFKRSSKRLFGQLGAAGGGAPCARAPTPVKIAAVVPAPRIMAFRLLIFDTWNHAFHN